MLSSFGLPMDRRMAEIDEDVSFGEIEEAELMLVAKGAAHAAELTEVAELLQTFSLGEERLGSVRLGDGRGSETGEELVNKG